MEYIEVMAWMALALLPIAALASIPAITLGQFLISRRRKKQQVRAGNKELAAKSVIY